MKYILSTQLINATVWYLWIAIYDLHMIIFRLSENALEVYIDNKDGRTISCFQPDEMGQLMSRSTIVQTLGT